MEEDTEESKNHFYDPYDEKNEKPIEKVKSDFTSSKGPNSTIQINDIFHYFCPDCHLFPKIIFIDPNRIEVTCDCYSEKPEKPEKPMLIKEFLELIQRNNNIDKNKINIMLLCQNNNHSKKFTYFCDNCKKNICDICKTEHTNHTLKSLDSPQINEKKFFILNFINQFFNKKEKELKNLNADEIIKTQEKNSTFHPSEASEFKSEIIKKGEINNINKIEFKNMELFSLISTIINDMENFNNVSHIKNIENIYNFLYSRNEATKKRQLQIEYKGKKMI